MIRHYIFDIGNVILKFDFSLAVARVSDRCTLEESEILPTLMPLHGDLETGRMPADEFIAKAKQLIGFSGEKDELRESFQDIFTLNDPIADLITDLDESGEALFLLSNTSDLHVPWFTREYSVFDRFHDAVYSHEAGVMKPDPKIFQIAAKQFDLAPEEAIYLDDLPANVEAATEAGFQAICYDHQDHSDFRRQFEARVVSG